MRVNFKKHRSNVSLQLHWKNSYKTRDSGEGGLKYSIHSLIPSLTHSPTSLLTYDFAVEQSE